MRLTDEVKAKLEKKLERKRKQVRAKSWSRITRVEPVSCACGRLFKPFNEISAINPSMPESARYRYCSQTCYMVHYVHKQGNKHAENHS